MRGSFRCSVGTLNREDAVLEEDDFLPILVGADDLEVGSPDHEVHVAEGLVDTEAMDFL